MLREVIKEILGRESDIHVVRELRDEAEVLSAAAEAEFDFVIIGVSDDALPSSCRDLLDRRPRVEVLGIESDGQRGYLHALRPYKRALGELSPATLLAAIRGAGS
jgi:DNA-binding NarL/FixJ family response regulator